MILIYPPEIKKIIAECDPYQIMDKVSFHWAPNTPQHIKDKWEEFLKWDKEMEALHEYEKIKLYLKQPTGCFFALLKREYLGRS